MKYIIPFLAISLFLLFYSLFVGRFPDKEEFRKRWLRSGYSIIMAVVLFAAGYILYFSVLAGFFFGVFGWCLPGIYMESKERKKREKMREITMDFILVASSMYGANETTPGVIEVCAQRLQEPLSSEFQDIIGKSKFGSNEKTIPELILDVAEKHRLPELKAAAQIIKRSATGGGARAASEGLMNLAEAIGRVNDQRKDRLKDTYESLTSAKVVLYGLLFGLLLNATVFRSINQQAPLVIGISCGLVLGFYFLIRRIGSSEDLEQV